MKHLVEELYAKLVEIGSCGDHYCIILKRTGMGTNGGCRCASDRLKMTQFAAAHNAFVSGIEDLLHEGRAREE